MMMTAIMALTAPANAGDLTSLLIAKERAALDQSDKGDAMAFVTLSAEDVVYQDPFITAPIKGRAALRAYYARFPAGDAIPGVMKDATVQDYGTLAILSFHYISHAGSKHEVEWNATEVYRQIDGDWRIVNTNWALIQPGAKAPN